MSLINIITNNMSRQLRNSTTYVDNYVYVPGTAITGDWTRPMIFESLDEFRSICGDHGVEGSYTYEYISGLLSAGLPVIFRRIAREKQDSDNLDAETVATLQSAHKATATINHTTEENTMINDVIVEEKFGGTFGNDMKVTVRNDKNTYWIDVYYKTSLLETLKVATYTDAELTQEDTLHTIAKRIIANLPRVSATSERINLTLATGEGAATPETFILKIGTFSLTGGTDFPDALVKDEIITSYDKISDKLLFQPKYITSGGYVDDDMTVDASIAKAMQALTQKRGDCIALIDIKLGTEKNQQATQADAVSYTQDSDTQNIPQAAVVAPWCYMQIGNTQEWMPGSYAYLTRVGQDISNGGHAYTPKAGTANGQVTNIIRPEFEIGSDLSEKWQEPGQVQINPILRLQGGAYIISGNNTLLKMDENEENVFSEISGAMTVLEIKRFVFNLANELQYQYNSATSFETFGLRTSDFLNTLISQGAVTDFAISNISDIKEPRKLKIKLEVSITPTIKSIDIYLNIAYGEVSVVTGGEE